MNERANKQEREPDGRESEHERRGELLQQGGPRIYVASLPDCNNGVLHGRWIEATSDAEDMQSQIAEMLAESSTALHFGDPAEEWAIHDYEGFGDLRLGEYESLDKVAKIASGIEKHGLAFSAWISHVGEQSTDLIEQFGDRFQGRWESRHAYAEYMLDELGANRVVDEAPDWLRDYLSLDVAGFARDLELGGDIEVVDASDDEGGVWVWSGH